MNHPIRDIEREYIWKLRLAMLIILGTVAIGTGGYMLVENFSLLDAFYMTIITIASVGYMEVRPLSDAGRLFTSGFIIVNLGILAYFISIVTTFVAEGDLKTLFRFRRMRKELDHMKDHVIVCGYGRNGKQVCRMLQMDKRDFVIIESREEILKLLDADKSITYIRGNATDDDVLREAGAEKAKSLITTLPSDPDNVYVVLTAKELNPKIEVISRASDEASELKLKRAGADHVIMPERIGGSYMASLVVKPDLSHFLSMFSGTEEFDFVFDELDGKDFLTEGKSATLRELKMLPQAGVLVIGLKKPDGNYAYNPPPQSHILPGTKLIVIGKPEKIEQLKHQTA